MDTTDPPGGEKPAADYIKSVLDREGIPAQIYAVDANRPNVVARLKGSGRKRPLLIMGHTDTSTSIRRSGRILRLARCAMAATSTAAAPSTTRLRTMWWPR